MINNVTLIGNTGSPADIKHLSETSKVARLSLATTDSYKDSEGNWQNKTEWHNVIGWNGLATIMKQITKGEKIYIEGKITYRTYEKDGEDRQVTDIVASTIRRLNPPATNSVGAPLLPTAPPIIHTSIDPRSEKIIEAKATFEEIVKNVKANKGGPTQLTSTNQEIPF